MSAALVLGAVTFGRLDAQQQAPPRNTSAAPPSNSVGAGPAHGIAVIDVTFILDRYARLKNATEAFKRDLETAETKLKKEREDMAKKAERLKGLKPGTPEFKNLEEELIKGESDWKLR